MGVPKFYRWLSERYVSVNHVISDLSLLPEFDNLYLDMNGIIHACTHPNDQEVSQGLSQEEMMKNIWNYVDRIVTQIVKPQKMLYVAVDGVAPRAKMNQQRSRRFRAAKDAAEAKEEAIKKGVVIDESTVFDSNCITPGTEFMAVVDAHLQYFIRKKMMEDPLWRRLTIIYSGHGIPGEGEHKIMQYIRDLKASSSYQPNVRHCMYGQDADLIMLALGTHEPHFTLLREVIDFGRGRTGGGGGSNVKTVLKQTKDASFQLLHLSILREYLEFEFLRDVAEEEREEHLERIVDDFVFLTFLVGNDFLPHLPSLDISEHAFDRLFELYGKHFKEWGGKGYLTNWGEIDIDRLQVFLVAIGGMEDSIFAAREEDVADFNARRRRTAKRFGARGAPVPSEEELAEKEAEAQAKYEIALAEAVKKGEVTRERAMMAVGLAPPASSKGGGAAGKGRKNDNGRGEGAAEGASVVGKKNFRGRYYFEKLGVLDPENSSVVKELCKKYVEGLQWCLAYYVKGCVSWQWFYPYHYGPLISDVNDLKGALGDLKFELGEPFKPFEQLLSCLPAASAKFLPRRYQFLMTSTTSPIKDFYPADFVVDMNGKHNPWEGVVLIPFVDEKRLKQAIVQYCPETAMTTEEKKRNSFTKILTFRHSPALSFTVPSCNPSLFPDLTNSQTTVSPSAFSAASLTTFAPRLVPGTVIPSPGFPSLKVLPIEEVKIEAIKVDVHGTESRYRTIILSLPMTSLPGIETLAPEILGRPVYVNWPMMHEARITAVTDGTVECRLEGRGEGSGELVTKTLSAEEQEAWEVSVVTQQKAFLYGRGLLGLGGVDVGTVRMMLKVSPLQGMERCPATGATKKVFGVHEATVPIQMAMWSVPTADPRFVEQAPVPLQDRLPWGAEVVLLKEGKMRGQVGKIVGYGKEGGKVKVETACGEPDRPIGLLARKALGNKYFDAGEVIRALNIDGRVLGKITGSCFVDPGNFDLGLNLKVRGKWVLPDYVRRKAVVGVQENAAWSTQVDVVRIVGSAEEGEEGGGGRNGGRGGYEREAGGVSWEYSEKAVVLLKAYMDAFPRLFEELMRWPNEVAYDARRLLGANHAGELESIRTWLAAQETANMPRVPLTTQVLSREAIRAIERSADELQAKAKKAAGGYVNIKTLEVAPEEVHCALAHQPADVARKVSGSSRPELGDRVVNLVGLGVPLGLKGTVVSLHKHSACVEVLFDEEFIGGTSLQGTCSPYRGKLLPWTALLKVTIEAGSAGTVGAGVGEGGKQEQRKSILALVGGGKRGQQQPQQPQQQQQQQQQHYQQQQQQQQQRRNSGKDGNSVSSSSSSSGGGVTRVPVKVSTREQQQQQRGGTAAPFSSSSASSFATNKTGQDLLVFLTKKNVAHTSTPNGSSSRSATTTSQGKTVDPRNAQGVHVPVRIHTSKPIVALSPFVPSSSTTTNGEGDGGGGGESFGGHVKAKGPDKSSGFKQRRCREKAGTVAERVKEEEAEVTKQEEEEKKEVKGRGGAMTRILGMLSLKGKKEEKREEKKEKAASTTAAMKAAGEAEGGEGGDATSSLKGLLKLNGGNNNSKKDNPAPLPPQQQQQQQHGFLPYPRGPAGSDGPGPFYHHPPPPPPPGGYYFPPSVPGAFIPPAMVPYHGGSHPHHPHPHPQSTVVPRRPRERRVVNGKGREGEGSAGAGVEAEGANNSTSTTTAKPAYIMPSQVLRSASASKKVTTSSDAGTGEVKIAGGASSVER